MTKLIPTLSMVLCLLACSNLQHKEEPDGGYCAYETENLPAIILEISRVDSTWSEVEFGVFFDEWGVPQDTLYYSLEFDTLATNNGLEALGVRPGDTLVYEHRYITEGSCNPDLFELKLERFN